MERELLIKPVLHRKLWRWLKAQIAQVVPDGDGLCEYDCRKLQCTEEEWASCERRVGKAAGELWPASNSAFQAETNASVNSSETVARSPETQGADDLPISVSHSN
jgi:hypothetical protein